WQRDSAPWPACVAGQARLENLLRLREVRRGREMEPEAVMHDAAQPPLGERPVPGEVHTERPFGRAVEQGRSDHLNAGIDVGDDLTLPPAAQVAPFVHGEIAGSDFGMHLE